MIEEIAAFIRQQVDEDERGALTPTERDWRPDGANSCQVYARRADHSNRTIAWCANGYGDGDDDFANALHIARHDPADALAEVRATRRILDSIPDWTDGMSMADYFGSEFEELVKLMALRYAHRDGYDERWRPAADR